MVTNIKEGMRLLHQIETGSSWMPTQWMEPLHALC